MSLNNNSGLFEKESNYLIEIFSFNRVICLTDLDNNLIFKNTTFRADGGFEVMSYNMNNGGVNRLEFKIFKNVANHQELINVKLTFSIFLEKTHPLPLAEMYITMIKEHDIYYLVTAEPQTIFLNKTLLENYSRTCRTAFCDDKCKLTFEHYIKNYKVKEISLDKIILEDSDKEDDYYTYGEVIFEKKYRLSIKKHVGNTINVVGYIPVEYANIKEIELVAGCDKNFLTCCNKFDNAINFRGEPFIPGYV